MAVREWDGVREISQEAVSVSGERKESPEPGW